ncbi:bifunctional sugar phosphate isomerase/epimerase/4-hydroxyphenylpyruvate dioxygenase family protein [Nonomuraea purpurea]|uniref:3-dehydroshikimate dehydratase n=1 Tax=Nonomuraea purpurea TaxID=1849276 RepID=A0ABV8GFJ3_9ACTN
MRTPRHDEKGSTVTASPRLRTGIATVCLSGMLDDKLDAAAAAGFDGVEIFENDLIVSNLSPEEIRRRCADLGLTIDLYQPFRDYEALPGALHRDALRRACHKLELMRRLGADTLLVCSTLSPHAIDDDDLAAEHLHTLAERAAGHGMRIAYEALAWGRHVNTWEHAWDIVQRADHPALGLCLDSFHVLSKNPAPTGIADIAAGKLFFLQLADAPVLDMDVLQWSRHHRLFPGQGAFDLPGFVKQVLAAGYTGPLSLEVFNDVFRQSDPRPAAADAMRSLLALRESLTVQPDHMASAVPPASPPLRGFSFAEVTVDDESGPQLTAALTALGFTHIGQHCTKPVQLWQQDSSNVLLNWAPSHPSTSNNAKIAAVAVESDVPQDSAHRAQALLAPRLHRRRDHAEADLNAVAAPDGTHIFFCGSGPGTDWRTDFTPTGQAADRTLLRHIDHIALAQPFDRFTESTLFYSALLGLDPLDEIEYAAPFGLVHSRTVADSSGRVRIALHGAVLRRGDWAPTVRDPEHIAFSTDALFSVARALRDRGAPVLAITDNYYDDLDARFALAPDLLSQMRDLNVLYDRDEHGELFHLYTEILGSQMFFEVLQRVNGYNGYGAANAPVRMAAHRQAREQQAGSDRLR